MRRIDFKAPEASDPLKALSDNQSKNAEVFRSTVEHSCAGPAFAPAMRPPEFTAEAQRRGGGADPEFYPQISADDHRFRLPIPNLCPSVSICGCLSIPASRSQRLRASAVNSHIPFNPPRGVTLSPIPW